MLTNKCCFIGQFLKSIFLKRLKGQQYVHGVKSLYSNYSTSNVSYLLHACIAWSWEAPKNVPEHLGRLITQTVWYVRRSMPLLISTYYSNYSIATVHCMYIVLYISFPEYRGRGKSTWKNMFVPVPLNTRPRALKKGLVHEIKMVSFAVLVSQMQGYSAV